MDANLWIRPDNAAFSGSARMMPPGSHARSQDQNISPVCRLGCPHWNNRRVLNQGCVPRQHAGKRFGSTGDPWAVRTLMTGASSRAPVAPPNPSAGRPWQNHWPLAVLWACPTVGIGKPWTGSCAGSSGRPGRPTCGRTARRCSALWTRSW